MRCTLFQHLCPFGVPVGDTTWESTRLCLPQRHGAERRRILRNMLFSRMVDVALERGIERYTGVIPDPFRKEVLAMGWQAERSEEHTSELQSLMRISYAVFCLKKKKIDITITDYLTI